MVVEDALVFVSTIPSARHFLTLLVFEASFGFLDDWLGVSIKIEVTSDLVWVEVVLLESVRSRNLTLLVDIRLVEHHLTVVVVHNILGFVQQIASLISGLTVFISISSRCTDLFARDYISLFVTIKVTHDVTLVEFP
jgi:hypothetical protein